MTLMLKLLMLTSIFYCSCVIANSDDLYDFKWLDPGKKVYVLQNKIHIKEKSLYIDIGFLTSASNEFQDTSGANLKIGYFLQENLSIEIHQSFYTSKNNSAYENIKAVNGTIPFVRKNIQSTFLFAVWSPFYGKVNTFNKIFYFDWYMGAGVGQLTLESNIDSVIDPNAANSFKREAYPSLGLKSGLKVYINKQYHLGIEFINQNYQAPTPKNPNVDKLKQNNDFIFSVGVSF